MTNLLSITNLIITRVSDYLNLNLKETVDTGDDAQAGLVKAGLLQDDPTRYRVNVTVHPNDPDAEFGWRDEVSSGKPSGDNAEPPGYEIGGGELWYRRFTVMIEMFFRNRVKTNEEALELASIIRSRAEYYLRHLPLSGWSDDFGEFALDLYVKASHLAQGGGEGQRIYHAKIWLAVLTGIVTV